MAWLIWAVILYLLLLWLYIPRREKLLLAGFISKVFPPVVFLKKEQHFASCLYMSVTGIMIWSLVKLSYIYDMHRIWLLLCIHFPFYSIIFHYYCALIVFLPEKAGLWIKKLCRNNMKPFACHSKSRGWLAFKSNVQPEPGVRLHLLKDEDTVSQREISPAEGSSWAPWQCVANGIFFRSILILIDYRMFLGQVPHTFELLTTKYSVPFRSSTGSFMRRTVATITRSLNF